jgi:hypothetical protein
MRRSLHLLAAAICSGLVLTSLSPGAGAEPADPTPRIDVNSPRGQTLGPAYLPPLIFGTPLILTGTSTVPVSFTVTGPCTARSEPGAVPTSTRVTLRATAATQRCSVTALAEVDGIAVQSATYDLPILVGVQTAPVRLRARAVPRSGQVILGPRVVRTNNGVPVKFRVTRGANLCRIVTSGKSTILRFGNARGICTVVATARGNRNFQPFVVNATYRIR